MRDLPRRFHLRRNEDVHEISGTGVVAEGCQFSNGWCSLTWLTHLSSQCWYHSIDVLERIHGHDGKTLIVFDDPPHEKAEDDADVGQRLAE